MLSIPNDKHACRPTELRVVSDIYFSRNIAIILIKKLQYAAQTIENQSLLAPVLPHLQNAGTHQLKKKNLLSHGPQKIPKCLLQSVQISQTHVYVLLKKKPFFTNLKQSNVQENGSKVLMHFPEIQPDPHQDQ